jgi:hypothetical protein
MERYTTALARTLVKVAIALEVLAWVVGIGGIIGGVAIALVKWTVIVTPAVTDSFGTVTAPAVTTTTHPYVAAGVATGVAVVVSAAFMWAVARALRIYGSTVAGEDARDGERSKPTASPFPCWTAVYDLRPSQPTAR